MTRLNIALYTEGHPFTGDTLDHRALGGAETAFLCVARELAGLGHHVTAYCVCEREGTFDNVKYRHASRAAALRAERHDLFICSRYFQVFQLGIQARCRMLWMHDPLIPQFADYLRLVLPSIDLIFCLSEYHRSLTAAVLPSAGPKLRKTHNGVDHDLIRRVTAGVPKRHKLMYTSCPERGLLDALDLYERLGDRDLEMLVASYVEFAPAYLARMQELRCRGFPVAAGNFKKADLYRHVAESKAVIYPAAVSEVFCIAAAEAQACGTAFLTVDDSAMRETVAYKGVPRGNLPAFFARTQEVLQTPALRQSLEEAGRHHAEYYTWRATARQFLDEMHAQVPSRPAFIDRFCKPATQLVSVPPRHEDETLLWAAAARSRTLAQNLSLCAASSYPPATNVKSKISCLTVTLGRINRLKRAIRCYCDQTYSNRELVIVTDAETRPLEAIGDHCRQLERSDIRLVAVNGRRSLGELRNIALECAIGEIVCQWDDDDLYHPLRLERQSAPLIARGEGACLLTDQLHFFEFDRALFWVDWTAAGRVEGVWQLIPGSLMMYREKFLYPETGPSARQGEDSALLETLCAKVPIIRLAGLGHLYLYTYHGANTFPREHFDQQLARTASRAFLDQRRPDLLGALDYYALPRPFQVLSHEGPFLKVGP